MGSGYRNVSAALWERYRDRRRRRQSIIRSQQFSRPDLNGGLRHFLYALNPEGSFADRIMKKATIDGKMTCLVQEDR